LAREVSNFSAELRGDDFKAVLHVLKSSYSRHSNHKNSLILCGVFLQGMHGSKIDVLLELIQPLVESQLCVVFCPSWQAEIGHKRPLTSDIFCVYVQNRNLPKLDGHWMGVEGWQYQRLIHGSWDVAAASSF
jgi:hypothetical protein